MTCTVDSLGTNADQVNCVAGGNENNNWKLATSESKFPSVFPPQYHTLLKTYRIVGIYTMLSGGPITKITCNT